MVLSVKTLFVLFLCTIQYTDGHDVTVSLTHNGKPELTRHRRSIYSKHRRWKTREHSGDERHATEITATIKQSDGTEVELNLASVRKLEINTETLVLRNGEFVPDEAAAGKEYDAFVDKDSGSVLLRQCDENGCSFAAAFYHGDDAFGLNPLDLTPYSNLSKSDKDSIIKMEETPRTIGYGWDGQPLDIPLTTRKRRDLILDSNMLKHVLRRKRQTTGPLHVVELILVADHSEYDFWLDRSGNNSADAKSAMELYFILLVNMMDLRYERMYEKTNYIDIKFMINAIIVAETLADSVWIKNSLVMIDISQGDNVAQHAKVNVEKALDEFTSWLFTVRGNFLPHDHVMGVSRYDMAALHDGEWSSGNLGSAWTGTMCKYPTFSVSLIEDAGLGLVDWVAAHELGHSLSSEHDIDGCGNFHLMSPVFKIPAGGWESSPYELSDCTVSAIETHINSLSTNCLQSNNYSDVMFTAYKSFLAPGVFLSVDTQCELAYGEGSRRCYPVSAEICSNGTYCWYPDDPNFCHILYVREGTACGSDVRCHRGKCETSTIETVTCPPKPSTHMEMSSTDTTSTPAYTTVLSGDHTPTFPSSMTYSNEQDYC